MNVAAACAVICDVLLLLKIIEFIPDNVWLWWKGPRIAAHAEHAGPESVRLIEDYGLRLADCAECSAVIRMRPRLSLRGDGIAENASVTLLSMRLPLSPLLRFLSRVTGRLFWTPLLVLICVVLFSVGLRGAPEWTIVVATVLFGVLGALTLLAAPVLRLSLGHYDVHFSDLARLGRFLRRRLPWRDNSKETLAFYFLGLIGTYLVCYAVLYQGIDRLLPGSFQSNRGSPDLFEWLYFSVSTASTLGDCEMHVLDTTAQVAVVSQTLSGPLILFWLLLVLIDRDQAIAKP